MTFRGRNMVTSSTSRNTSLCRFDECSKWDGLCKENSCHRTPECQRGMFPCFFFGFTSRLFSSARRAVMMRCRVSAGSITASR